MSYKPVLRIDWATHEAAKYACEKWHYSRVIPKSKLAKFGVWEDGEFIGVVIFGVGVTRNLVKQYGLVPEQGCELVRVALKAHFSPVSRIVAICVRILRASFPGLRMCVSFADPKQGHHGGIYQAGGWIFSGNSPATNEYLYKGKLWHARSFLRSHKGMERHPDVQVIKCAPKHRYLLPLDAAMREKITPLAKPYPKRVKKQDSECPSELGGAVPTDTLQNAAVNPAE